MPEPASSRSLEDILASIRRSLADESVDGLVELSAAAVDAARADIAAPAAKSAGGAVSAADALADDLLRDKLAGALVLDTDTAEADVALQDQAESGDFQPAEGEGAGADLDQVQVDSATLAKLWVLRPGLEQAKPTAAPAQTLTLDPFAGADAAAGSASAQADFTLSPRDILGDAKVLAAPLASMPPLPLGAEAKVSPAAAVPEPSTSGPPRLDPDSIALLKKLRASNASAIEKIARANEEAEAEAEPEPEPEPDVLAAESTAPLPEDIVAQAQEDVAEAASAMPEPLATIAQEDVRPLLSLPERSTPLFGGHADARPLVTSGVDHLLAEQGGVASEALPDVAVSAAEPVTPPEETVVVEPPLAARVEDEIVELVVVEASLEVPAEAAPQAEPEAEAEAEAALPEAEPEVLVAAEPEMPPAIAPEVPAEVEPAVAQAAAPAGNKALEDMIAAVLEPVLQRLIETSIGPALEALVRREVERALKEQQPPQ